VYLGLTGGLARYNGQTWDKIYYNEADPNEQANYYNIRTLALSSGKVWAGTNEGLIKFDGSTHRIYNCANTPSMVDDHIRGIAADTKGNIWFMNWCLGIFKLDVAADTVCLFNVPMSTPLPFISDATMFCDADGTLWYSIYDNVVRFKDGSVKVLDSTNLPLLKQDSATWIQLMPDNSVAILFRHNIGFYRNGNGDAQYEPVAVPAGLLEENECFNMVKTDPDGNIWVLGRNYMGEGIFAQHFYRCDKNGMWTKYEFPVFEGTTSNYYGVTDFTIDHMGRVWFSDAYYGVFMFDSKVTSVESIPDDPSVSIYPNPADEHISVISGRDIRHIEIYSVMGTKVLDAGHKDMIDISRLSPGLYFLQAFDGAYKHVAARTFSVR
jgi:streptogramin lyase